MSRKTFSRKIIRQRNKIEARGQKLAFAAIKAQYQQVYGAIDYMNPKSLFEAVPSLVTPIPMYKFFEQYYPMSAPIAVEYRNYAIGSKATDDQNWQNLYSEQLRHYGLTEAGSRIVDITATTEKYIRGAVESATTAAAEQGMGVDKTAKLIREYLQDSLGDIGTSRAKMIAQTELITASNRASQYGADSTGLPYKKIWSTSGLRGIRPTHQQAENDSMERGGIPQNERFSNGLMFPGDPAGPPEEVINCRCISEIIML